MRKFLFCFFFAFLILFCATLLNAADDGKKTIDKSLTSAVADDAKEIKKEFHKTKDETKEAIVRDVKTIKEQTPKDVKEVKTEFKRKSNAAKTNTKEELKEIRESLKKPIKPSTTQQKK